MQAYFITRNQDQLQHWNYSLANIRRASVTLGIQGEPKIFFGGYVPPAQALCERMPGTPICRHGQLALSMAYLDAWSDMVQNNVSSAYIFEDDVVFDDNLDSKFAQVSSMPSARELACISQMWWGKVYTNTCRPAQFRLRAEGSPTTHTIHR